MNTEPTKNNSSSKSVLEIWKKIFVGSILIIPIAIIAMIISAKNPLVYDGCVVAKTPIEYQVMKQKTRESSFKNKFIQECYILIKKSVPSIYELEQFAVALGKNNDNIEFKIFDEEQAYELYELYVVTNREDEAPQKDWDFLEIHFLASYLKSDVGHNRLQPSSSIYMPAGQTSISTIQINN